MLAQLDMPVHKIAYVVHNKELVKGLWGSLNAYGVQYTKYNHEILVEIVQTKLVGNDAIEYEWAQDMYDNFVNFTI